MRQTLLVAILFTLLAGAGSAAAAAPPSPWDGSNPYRCVIQNAGLGTTVPDPGADPYCVMFDKTQQNVTQLGIIDFLLKEPARVAAAVPKCFYFQEDHWRGSLVQSDQRTVLYEFYGHYLINKATGDGGVWVTGLKIGGLSVDPTALPGFPPTLGGYFGPGTGGFITHDDFPVDPHCAALAKDDPAAIYTSAAATPHCVPAAGRVDSGRVGPLTLGITEGMTRTELGAPQAVRRGFLHYCVTGGGELLAGERADRSGMLGTASSGQVMMLLTTSPAFLLRGSTGRSLHVGARWRRVAPGVPRARRLLRLGHTSVLRLAGDVIAGVRRGRIVYFAIYSPRAIRSLRALRGYLERSG